MRLVSFVAAFTMMISTASAEQIWLTMDQVRPYELKAAAGQVVVGNPAIADIIDSATTPDRDRLMLVGRSPGMTNIFIFDENGEPIQNLQVRVRTNDMLTFHRGPTRLVYSCTSHCEQTVTVGDDANAFQTALQQAQSKADQARNAAGVN